MKWLNKYGFWIITFALAIYVGYKYIQSQPEMSNGAIAPEFTFTGMDQKEYHLSDFKGKYVFIDFWGSWCPPCRRANPKWAEAYQELMNAEKYHSDKIVFVSIASENDKSKWLKAVNEDGLIWKTQAIDSRIPEKSIIDLYGVNAFPTNYFIDPDGIIIGVNINTKFVKRRLRKS